MCVCAWQQPGPAVVVCAHIHAGGRRALLLNASRRYDYRMNKLQLYNHTQHNFTFMFFALMLTLHTSFISADAQTMRLFDFSAHVQAAGMWKATSTCRRTVPRRGSTAPSPAPTVICTLMNADYSMSCTYNMLCTTVCYAPLWSRR